MAGIAHSWEALSGPTEEGTPLPEDDGQVPPAAETSIGPSCGSAQSCSGLRLGVLEPPEPEAHWAPACDASAAPIPGTAQSWEACNGPAPDGTPLPEPLSVQLLPAPDTTAGPTAGMAQNAVMLGAPVPELLLELELLLLFVVSAEPVALVLLVLPQPDNARNAADSRTGAMDGLIFIKNACLINACYLGSMPK